MRQWISFEKWKFLTHQKEYRRSQFPWTLASRCTEPPSNFIPSVFLQCPLIHVMSCCSYCSFAVLITHRNIAVINTHFNLQCYLRRTNCSFKDKAKKCRGIKEYFQFLRPGALWFRKLVNSVQNSKITVKQLSELWVYRWTQVQGLIGEPNLFM